MQMEYIQIPFNKFSCKSKSEMLSRRNNNDEIQSEKFCVFIYLKLCIKEKLFSNIENLYRLCPSFWSVRGIMMQGNKNWLELKIQKYTGVIGEVPLG